MNLIELYVKDVLYDHVQDKIEQCVQNWTIVEMKRRGLFSVILELKRSDEAKEIESTFMRMAQEGKVMPELKLTHSKWNRTLRSLTLIEPAVILKRGEETDSSMFDYFPVDEDDTIVIKFLTNRIIRHPGWR